ncbi:hypothetical protein ABPG74_000416 [Tetrahymena malaccensis]
MVQKNDSDSKIQKDFVKIIQDTNLFYNETNELEEFYNNTYDNLYSLFKEKELKLHLKPSNQKKNANDFLMLLKPKKNLESIIGSFGGTTYCNNIRNKAKIIGDFVFLDGFCKINPDITIRVVKYKLNKQSHQKYKKYQFYLLVHFFERNLNQQLNKEPNNSFQLKQNQQEKSQNSSDEIEVENIENEFDESEYYDLIQQNDTDKSQNSFFQPWEYDLITISSQNQLNTDENNNQKEQKENEIDPRFTNGNSNNQIPQNIFEDINLNLQSEKFSFIREQSNNQNQKK